MKTHENWLCRHFCSLRLPNNQSFIPLHVLSLSKCKTFRLAQICSLNCCHGTLQLLISECFSDMLATPNNFSYMNDAKKSVPGLTDVGVLNGDGDGPRTPPRFLEAVRKSFNWLILLCLTASIPWSMLKNQSLALLMLGSSMGMGMAPRPHPDVWRG